MTQQHGPMLALDDIYVALIRALQDNARLGHTELGRQLGLSATAVADRMRKLEDHGLITGYHAAPDAARMGYGMTAFVRLRTTRQHFPAVQALVAEFPNITECHVVTGEDSFLMRIHAHSVQHLDQALLALSVYGPTTSSIVLQTVLPRKNIMPHDSKD